VFTASAGPALAIQPLAAARDILVIHQGAATARFAPGSRTLLRTRPSVDYQVDGLLAHVAGRRLRRLAVVAAGDEFGKAVRAAVSARSRERGGTVVAEESLTLDAPDLPARLRQLVRAGPEAIVLGFRGPDLGEVAERLRAARYVGALYLLDDDRSARLAGGVALQGAVIVTDAFVPELAAPSERFADAYRAKFGETPSRYAAHAYDAVVMLAEGIRRSIADRRGIPGGSRLREALTVLSRVPSVYGDSVVLRDDGSLATPLALFTVDGGDLAFVHYVRPADRS
jgi:branched-chain amino acid transport system substrate-binding protein